MASIPNSTKIFPPNRPGASRKLVRALNQSSIILKSVQRAVTVSRATIASWFATAAGTT